MFGALGGVLPLRLGGSETNGLTAAQHARICADLVAASRTVPFASWSYTKSGATVTVSNYSGRNGTGPAFAPTPTVNGTGDVTWSWASNVYEDEREEIAVIAIRGAQTSSGSFGAPAQGSVSTTTVTARTIRITSFDLAGTAVDVSVSVTAWGDSGAGTVAIGDYGGDLEKEDSDTEGRAPYAAHILTELQEQRGTAYTTTPGRLVDVENLALARFLAAAGPRTAEKLRANATPARSDERLAYWQKFLAVPTKPGEPKWRLRHKLAAHYRSSEGPTRDAVIAALQDVLGDAFVDATWEEGATLSVPPTPTYWPDINPGNVADSLGGGTWLSARAHLFVEVQIPVGMSIGAFLTLVTVDMPPMLDRLLPAWATFDWGFGGGFLVAASETDVDAGLVDFTGL